MIYYLQYIDWRVVLLALFAYYFLPSLLIGELLDSLTEESSVPAHLGRPVASYFAFFYLLLPPVLAGRFAARFARHLPLTSALVLTLLGSVLTTVYGPVSAQLLTAYTLVCLSLGMLGVHSQGKRQPY